MGKKKVELTGGEWAIMEVVWVAGDCTAPDVREALAEKQGWTYSTVKTMMERMVGKGILKSKKLRNLTIYSAGVEQSEAKAGEIMRAVKRAFGGALSPMVQFMVDNEKLSGEELAEIEEMIKKKRKKG